MAALVDAAYLSLGSTLDLLLVSRVEELANVVEATLKTVRHPILNLVEFLGIHGRQARLLVCQYSVARVLTERVQHELGLLDLAMLLEWSDQAVLQYSRQPLHDLRQPLVKLNSKIVNLRAA